MFDRECVEYLSVRKENDGDAVQAARRNVALPGVPQIAGGRTEPLEAVAMVAAKLKPDDERLQTTHYPSVEKCDVTSDYTILAEGLESPLHDGAR